MNDRDSTNLSFDPYLLAQVRESFGRVVYSHKTHEKQADICFAKHRIREGVLIVLTAASSGTFLAALVGALVTPAETNLITSFIALLVTAISLSTKKFKYAEEAEAHRDTASALWNVRESYISLISDLMAMATSDLEAHERRNQLQFEAHEAYATAPRTSHHAYKKASTGLKKNEELTFTSGEIDLFLPEELRLNAHEKVKETENK